MDYDTSVYLFTVGGILLILIGIAYLVSQTKFKKH